MKKLAIMLLLASGCTAGKSPTDAPRCEAGWQLIIWRNMQNGETKLDSIWNPCRRTVR